MIVEVSKLSRTVSIYFFLLIFEYFITWKNSFFRRGCQHPGRYAKLKPFSYIRLKQWKLPLEFKSYDHFVGQTNFPDFYWRHQRHGYGIWNFLSCPFSLPSFIFMTVLKLGLEGRRQYDATRKKQGSTRDGIMDLKRLLNNNKFFPMVLLFACNQHNTQSTEVSYFDNSTMRTQLNSTQLNSIRTEPSTFFNLTNQVHYWLRKIRFFS